MAKRADKTNNGTIRKFERILSQMGLAASQARLLTITARLADNELRSQTINNAKMRLATQSAQASDEYISALNNAQLMFSNVGIDGLAQKQPLTFNALTQYSQYNNQYGIVDSAGRILVSEEDAAIFKKHSNDLEGFLKAHGLEWETTFFDDNTLQDKLSSFYTGDNAYIANLLNQTYNGKTGSEALKERYLDSLSQDASIENMNYQLYAQKYYQESIQLYNNVIPQVRNDILGDSDSGLTEEIIANAIVENLTGAADIVNELTTGAINPGGAKRTDGTIGTGATAAYAYNVISQYLTEDAKTKIDHFLSSLTDDTYPGGVGDTAGFQCDGGGWSDIKITHNEDEGTTKYTFHKLSIVVNESDNTGYLELLPRTERISWYYNGVEKGNDDKIEYSNVPTEEGALKDFIMNEMAKVQEKMSDGDEYLHSFQRKTINGQDWLIITNIYNTPRKDVYRDFIMNYLDMILNCEKYFDPEKYANNHSDIPSLEEFNESKSRFYQEYSFIPSSYDYLIDFEKLIKSGTYGSSDAFNSVLNSWLVDKMLDVLGEPKYAWVDKTDKLNTGNADAKSQWLTNLFNRMQKGYKVLENGLAKSQEWLEYAFESGLVSMEQVDLSFNWTSMDYKTCSNIYEETDNSADVAKAEAKYNRAMNDIKQKDQLFDLQLKNIDTEHSALQTEYDVVKGVMNKNIERTMKFNQNA